MSPLKKDELRQKRRCKGWHMSIIKNQIPILEFDAEETAVIEPCHEKLDIRLPRKCVFAFLGDYIDEYAHRAGAQKVSCFVSNTKKFPVYITKYKGEELVLCQAPVGAAAAAQLLDWLIGYGVRKVISAGTCGCLEKLPEAVLALVLPRQLRISA